MSCAVAPTLAHATDHRITLSAAAADGPERKYGSPLAFSPLERKGAVRQAARRARGKRTRSGGGGGFGRGHAPSQAKEGGRIGMCSPRKGRHCCGCLQACVRQGCHWGGCLSVNFGISTKGHGTRLLGRERVACQPLSCGHRKSAINYATTPWVRRISGRYRSPSSRLPVRPVLPQYSL